MATIRTYQAALERLRPDDRGFTAQENAARRLQFATQDEVQALREGGKLAAQNIRTQFSADQALLALQNPAPARGGGGGGGGGTPRGSGSPSQIAAPREAAQVAGTLGKILGGMQPNDSNLPRTHSYPLPPYNGYFDPLTGDSAAIRSAAGSLDFQETDFGRDRFTLPPVGERRAIRNPVRDTAYDYEYPGGAPPVGGTYDPNETPGAGTPQRLLNYLGEFAGAIASSFSAPTVVQTLDPSATAGDY